MPIHIESLSDEVGRRLGRAEKRVEGAETERNQVRMAEAEARVRLDEATRTKGLWKRLFRVASSAERAAARRLDQLKEDLANIEAKLGYLEIEQAQLAKGHAGQQILPNRYRVSLSDEWFLYNGVLTESGEIDHVLGGPTGVWAIEIKNEAVLLAVDGDRWQKTRLSRQGRTQETAPAVDGGGRTWGREVGEPAEALAAELASVHPVPVHTAVVLVDPLAEIVRCQAPGVDLVTADLEQLDRTISGRPVLDRATTRAIGERVVAVHRRSVGRRRGRRHTSRPSRSGTDRT